LAPALRLHWLCAYAFMLNGAMYVAGSIAGGGWRGLLPRRNDLLDGLRMLRYYLGIPYAKLSSRMGASAIRHKVQPASARSVLLRSTRRLPFGRYRMGDSQAHAVSLARRYLWRVRCGARLAFLAHVGLHPFRGSPCDSGFRRRVGYAAQHDRRLVGKSKADGGHGS